MPVPNRFAAMCGTGCEFDHGQIAGFFPRDPGWVLWHLAERVMQNNTADDVDLIRASLALPASAIDL